MARGARSATVCEAVAVKWANASNRRGPQLAYIPAGAGPLDHAGRPSTPHAASRSRRSPAIALSAARPSCASPSSAPTTCSHSACAACSSTLRRMCPCSWPTTRATTRRARAWWRRSTRPSRAPAGRLPAPAGERGLRAQRQRRAGLLAPADVIVLNSDCVVPEGWYEGMRRAAYLGHARGHRLDADQPRHDHLDPGAQPPGAQAPQEWSLEDGRGGGARREPGTPPHAARRGRPLLYIRRSALDLVGDFDEAFAPGYEEEVDFSHRCIRQGSRTCWPTTCSSSTTAAARSSSAGARRRFAESTTA